MRTSFAKRLLGVAAALVCAVPAVQALPPINKEVKVDPKVKTATTEEQFKHGMRLIVTMKDKTHVQGTLVMANDADNYMLIRTKPGVLPTKVMGNNIADITRIRLTGPTGGTLPDEPEIQPVSIINGEMTQVKYFAPNLSPRERAKLTDIENAYNDVSQSNYQKSAVDQAMAGELQTLKNAIVYQDLSNKLMSVDLMYNAAGWFPAYVYSPLLTTSGGGVSSSGGPAASMAMGNLLTMQAAVQKESAKTREHLAAALRNAYFEGDQLVAVIPDGQGVRPAVAPEK
jgi:hypothetical protein